MNSNTSKKISLHWAKLPVIAATVLLATACTSVPNPPPQDPWESYNRSVFAFNDAIDGAILKPVASGYVALTPQPVRTCVHNMFNNLRDIWSGLNSFLQGEPHDFFNTLGRVLFNSTMGLGGCIDVATMNGSRRIQNDFGITLGVWGLDAGPYFVLPFLGPSTVRDASGAGLGFLSGASGVGPIFDLSNVPVRNSILALDAVDARANLLDTEKLINEIALDRYSFIRDAYLQRREAQLRARTGDADTDGLPDYSDDEDDE
ncbi:MlaA family lipoprotein [Alcaligenes endophyticus]|uniref:VacJ family lipoprotein n=1 Tax=Alcaligenes endophyticus TaxID=1929088 RepID=A0ABT8EFC8_9BURK|nr:VacJ family lipoprotein [Alcaligenes endophyticus]MCX5590355.1 VacJ family lipoprotein [Alcaligenes endophyticus]MDN4119981.1 VacJ family lipoprotein [Alcaligenes endophyticus]